jgi:Transcriptional regulators
VLSLLSDDHARDILAATREGPAPAREIADQLNLSRATVYRRLNRLEKAGLVDSSLALHSEGHHRKQFRATVDGVSLALGDGGLSFADAA